MLETERLILRNWHDGDLPEFAKMNADKKVMEFFPATLTPHESDNLVARIRKSFSENGFGLWSVEVKNGAPFTGFIGLNIPTFAAHFTPCVEIGWRLAYPHWGKGYATEGANEVLKYGFDVVGLKEILSWTATINTRSQAVIKKIGRPIILKMIFTIHQL